MDLMEYLKSILSTNVKYHYDDNFLIGTYAFTRQLALSIEHTSGEWEYLKSYMNSRNMWPTLFLLIDIKALTNPPLNKNLRANLISLIFSKGYLTGHELVRLMLTITNTSDFIYQEESKERHVLRIVEILHKISTTIRGRVFKKDNRLKMADQVEHFNQSNHGIFYSVEDIIPFDSFEIKKTSKRR